MWHNSRPCRLYLLTILCVSGPNCDGNELTNPVNGMVTFSTTTIGSTATYTCDVGYRLEGVSTRMCDVIAGESKWSGTTPICQSKSHP